MSILEDLCPRGEFESLDSYDRFTAKIEEYIAMRKISRIKPTIVSDWDIQAEFFFDIVANEIFMLHHPEPPSHGSWSKVTLEYIGGDNNTN